MIKRGMWVQDSQGNDAGQYEILFYAKGVQLQVAAGRHLDMETAFRHAMEDLQIARAMGWPNKLELMPTGPAPPDLGQELACFLLPADRKEDVLGDLEEMYRIRWLPTLGPRWAGWCFIWHVLISSPILARMIGGFRRIVGR